MIVMKEIFRVFLFVCFFGLAQTSHAATLYIEPGKIDMYPGDTRTLAVRIDTEEGECINVVDGFLTYSDSIQVVDVSLGESILPVWVEAPKINTDSRTVTFAGGIPNGYCGRIDGDPRLTNVILELVVQYLGLPDDFDKETDVAEVSFTKQTAVYLNDGSGNRTQLVTLDSALNLHLENNGEVVNEWNSRVEEDTQPPNSFSISLQSEPSIFNGKHFIVFNTTDKQSGIDHYEIMEESIDDFRLFAWGGTDANWVEARSPYQLKDQSLNSTIRVKAIDKAGNEYMAVLVPEEGMRGISKRDQTVMVFATLGLLILFGLIFAFGVYWFRTKKEENESLESNFVSQKSFNADVSENAQQGMSTAKDTPEDGENNLQPKQ